MSSKFNHYYATKTTNNPRKFLDDRNDILSFRITHNWVSVNFDENDRKYARGRIIGINHETGSMH